MRTVGEILSEKRKSLGLSLADIEKETKIRAKCLEVIEKNDFSSFGESTTAKGFIRNYAQALGLSAENTLAVFRRDFSENEKGQIIPKAIVESLNKKKFSWTPKLTLFTAIFLLLVGVGFFLANQYQGFSSAPPLEVSSPLEGQILREKVLVVGKTDKDASVKIDGSLIFLGQDGTFKEEIILPRGENIVIVETANRQGKRRVISRKVKVE